MKDILDKIKSMDKKQLGEAVKQAKAFAATAQGQELVEKMKNGEAGIDSAQQEAISKSLRQNPEIAKIIFDILKG